MKMDTIKLDVIAVIVPSMFKQNMLEEILETLLLWVSNLFFYSEDNLNWLVYMYCTQKVWSLDKLFVGEIIEDKGQI